MFNSEDEWFDYWAEELENYYFNDWCALND